MQSSLLQQGIELMLFGMGTVFMFLACLVLVTTLMSKLLQRLAPTQEIAVPTPTTTTAQQDDQIVAVISAAVHQYRSRRKP